jgi:uncharacterized protein YjbI with pentapeptide repeats
VDQQQEPRWQPTRRQLLWTGVTVGLLSIAVLIGYHYDITLWDWIKLLVVPVVIAGGGLWFNRQQRERELEIAERHTQDEALQAYLDQMSDMLIPNTDQPSLYKARPGDSLSSVARARTLTVLSRLDGDRKARVVQFLYESRLIAKERPVLDLRGANLSGVDLRRTKLSEALLSNVDLSAAHLSGADLSGADLRRVLLSEAKAEGVFLKDADLIGADLRGADLREANLYQANLGWAKLGGADLREAVLYQADLGGAELNEAFLGGAKLGGADLRSANLSGAKLRKAGRRIETTFMRAKGWTATDDELDDHLVGVVKSLKGATMPNGQKYEDWLKDRERSKEDGENE